MKKYFLLLMICIIVLGLMSGCDGDISSPSLKEEDFVKPKNYATIVNVEINSSFDIYLDEQAIVLAIESKNEDAKKFDVSGAIGRNLANSMRELKSTVCKNSPDSTDSAVLVKVLEGEEITATVDVVETIKDAWADTVAKETVNNSMESVVRARLEFECGCRCKDCLNWYARYWYSFGKWDRKWDYDEYEDFMKRFGVVLGKPNNDDSLETLAMEIHKNMTYEKCNTKEYRRQLFNLEYENPQRYHILHQLTWNSFVEEVTHEEIEIAFKIVDSEVNGNGITVKSKEYSTEEYFEKYPEDREVIEGLEKAFKLSVRVYENGQWDGKSYYQCFVYLVDGEWYVNNGLFGTPGG